MKPIGFSHQVLFRSRDPYTKENLQFFINCGCAAVEINFHHSDDAPLLKKIMPFIQDFDYISLHAPGNLRYRLNEETRSLLQKMAHFYTKARAQLTVVHPDIVDNLEVFKEFPLNWAIENMDNEKNCFRDVADLRKFFAAHPDWNFVFDISHAVANDLSLSLASDMMAEFGRRVAEIHLSGHKIFHDPLHRTKQTKIMDCCHGFDVPIIIESTFAEHDGFKAIQKEFDYIRSYLLK